MDHDLAADALLAALDHAFQKGFAPGMKRFAVEFDDSGVATITGHAEGKDFTSTMTADEIASALDLTPTPQEPATT
jgi:hypothetical protein